MFSENNIPMTSAYMKMFQKPVIFNFNPENNLYLLKNNFKIISPEDFTLLSLPTLFKQLSLTELKNNELFREKFSKLFTLIPKEVILAKDLQMQNLSNSLMIPMITPPEYQGSYFHDLIKRGNY